VNGRSDLDELLKPTLRDQGGRDPYAPAPWRLGSIVYVAFFGGALAAGAISLLNARRLGLPVRTQAAIAALAVAGFAGALVAAALVGGSSDTNSSVRVAARAVALVAFGGMYLLMRSADRVHHYHHPDDETAYDSLWGPGFAACLTLGIVETAIAFSLADA
jgi:hypothetical protein